MTMNEGQDFSGQQPLDQDLPLDETGLEEDGAAAPEEQAPAWYARVQSETQESLRKIEDRLRATQGQASQAERRVGELQNIILQRAASPEPPTPDPYAGLDLDAYDPAIKAVIVDSQRLDAQLKRLLAKETQAQAQAEAQWRFDNAVTQARRVSRLAGVNFDTEVAPKLTGITTEAEYWETANRIIEEVQMAAKSKPNTDATRRQERRQVEATQGVYSERRSGSTGRGSQKPSDLRDAYGEGRISSSQYEAGMKQLGLEP